MLAHAKPSDNAFLNLFGMRRSPLYFVMMPPQNVALHSFSLTFLIVWPIQLLVPIRVFDPTKVASNSVGYGANACAGRQRISFRFCIDTSIPGLLLNISMKGLKK